MNTEQSQNNPPNEEKAHEEPEERIVIESSPLKCEPVQENLSDGDGQISVAQSLPTVSDSDSETSQKKEINNERKSAKAKPPKRLIVGIFAAIVVAIIAIAIGFWVSFSNNSDNYGKAKDALDNGNYSQASEMFSALGNFSDAASYTIECDAIALYNDGKYSQALEKFNELGDFDKAPSYAEIIPTESTIAYICALSKDAMKDPDSFKLRNVWEDFDSRVVDDLPNVVLKIQGSNSYGANISNYWLISGSSASKDSDWTVLDAFSDLEEETYSKYTSSSRKKEIKNDNTLKWAIKQVIAIGNEIDESVINRVNDLNDKGLLDKKSIELVDASKKLTAETDA